MFVGRNDELGFLNEKYESNRAEFVVIYGRRRIGKTALIKEFIKDKKHIFYSAVQITDNVQLEKLSTIILNAFDTKTYTEKFGDWELLFRFLADQCSDKEKNVIVLDEFPYMVESNQSLPSVLQKIWDHYFKDLNVMFIISGSSMSFMEKEILSEKNPLYGRTTGILRIEELGFEVSRAFMGDGSLSLHMDYYSIFSGVPYYLSLIDPKASLRENIKSNILKNGSVLFNEVEFLLKQELREVAQYNAIIESIALGDTKLNDIYQKTGIEKTKLPYYLGGLIDLGIVKKEYPSTIKVREQAKRRSGIYKIDNSYFRFYYSFVYPYISELMEGNIDVILEDVIMERLSMFTSTEFEKVAIAHLRELVKSGQVPIRPVRIGRWWNKNTKIDIVAYDLNGFFMFGECKWRNEKVSVKVLNHLKHKSQLIETVVNEKCYILFSKSGFTKDLIAYSKEVNNLILVDYSGLHSVVISQDNRAGRH